MVFRFYYNFIFIFLASCKPFGGSFFEAKHLIPEDEVLSDITVKEDEDIPELKISFQQYRENFSCEKSVKINFENKSLIESIKISSADEAWKCKVKIKTFTNTFGVDTIKIVADDLNEGAESLKEFKLKVEQLGDDEFLGGEFKFANASDFVLSSSEFLETVTQNSDSVVRLKYIDTTDSDTTLSSTDKNFANYTSKDSSVQLNSTTGSLQLGADSSSDSYDESFAELDASWTPQWSSLMSYWKFNEENNSTTARDSKGSVTLSGFPVATFNGSKKWLGKAAFFNGSFSAYVTSSIFTQLTNITFAGWIYVESLPLDSQIFYVGQPGSTGWGPRIGNGCSAGTSFNVILGGITCSLLSGTPTVTTGNWIHLVVRRDGSYWTYFINGLPAQTNYPTNNPNAPAVGMLFGQNFNGYLDEFAFWQSYLGWEDIAAIYNRQAAKYGGNFLSRVIDIKNISNPVESVEMKTSLPFGKEIANSNENLSSGDSGYIYTPSSFLNGLISYFRFNSTVAVIPNGSILSSTIGPNATAMNVDAAGLTYISTRMNSGIRFDSTDDAINLGTTLNPTTQSFTISFWQRSLPNGTSFWTFLSNRNSATGNSGIWITQRTDGGAEVGKLRVQLNTSALVNNFNVGTTNVSDGDWHHVVVVVDRTSQRMHWYVDGKVDVANIDISGVGNISSSLNLLIGRDASTYSGGGSNFRGDLDEFGMWDRVLTQSEVIELYRRHANQIRYQIRWCNQADCSDGNSFVGIDGGIASYLSEALNTSGFTSTSSVNSSGLSFVFSQVAAVYSGFQTWLNLSNTKRYFQYRAYLESTDSASSTLCDSSNRHTGMSGFSSGTQPCMPDIKSVKLGPSRYDNQLQNVKFIYPVQMDRSFFDLKSFEVEYGNNLCQASLGFQLGLADTQKWYVFKNNAWTSTEQNTESNTVSEINNAISRFPTEIGRGRLNIKVMLQSIDGLKNCEIKRILVKGTQ